MGIAEIDKEGTGTIDFNDFLTMMTQKMSEKDTKEEILKAFRLFDDDETGKISFKNLKRVAKKLGENLTDEELQEMIDEADRDGDGEINEGEFLRIMKKNQSLLISLQTPSELSYHSYPWSNRRSSCLVSENVTAFHFTHRNKDGVIMFFSK